MKRRHGESDVRLCDTAESGRLIAVLEGIAAELGWQPGRQLRDYQAQAVHFAAYVDGVLAGGMQLVPAALCRTLPSDKLPCELVWPEVRLPRRAETAHISILALKREHRGTAELLWPLCVAMWRYCAAQGIADISLEVTPDLHRLYLRLGWPLEIVGELRPHWGEDRCYLCRMGTADVAGAMVIKAMRSRSYQGIVGMMSELYEKTAVEDEKTAAEVGAPAPAALLRRDVACEIIVDNAV